MADELKPLPKNPLLRGGYLMLRRYLGHEVAIQSAALAFYLLFTIFPLLIFFSSLLGLLHLDAAAILAGLGEILPATVVELIRFYLEYVERNASMQLMWFGLFFSLYFPMRAAGSLMRAVRTAYHLGPARDPLRQKLKSLVYTVFLIVTVVLTLVLLTVGDMALAYAMEHFHLPALVASLWSRLRFPVMGVLMFSALVLLYAMSQDDRQPLRNIWPGVLGSMAAWMVISLGYSFYVEHFASYSVIYGSIGTVIVLLIWLYLSAATMIMGAELNGTLISLRKDAEGA